VVWQRDAGVEGRDRLVVPSADLARVDAGERWTVELQVRGVEAGKIVVDGQRRDRQRHVDDVRVFLGLRIRHVGVRGADVYRAGNSLFDASSEPVLPVVMCTPGCVLVYSDTQTPNSG
jgi:hypothetical protein